MVTATIFDRNLVITDIARSANDYRQMGLPANPNSLHYSQTATGYVHAVDLRTINRSEMLNILTKLYFNLTGFHTHRHTGTNDHLHVSLPVTGGSKKL